MEKEKELDNLKEISLALMQLESSSYNISRNISEWRALLNEDGFDTFNYEFREAEFLSRKLSNNILELKKKIEYIHQKK